MNVPDDRLSLSNRDERGIDVFDEWVWSNSEVCNSCFGQVRSIGPKVTKRLEEPDEKLLENGLPVECEVSEWYERTETGSQEHTSWDENKRFGTCFCLDCGTDCTGNHRHKTVSELAPLAANIYRYIETESPFDVDHRQFGREIRDLKQQPDLQGYETEIIAVAFSRALQSDVDELRSNPRSH